MTDAYLRALIEGARQYAFPAQILWHAWHSGDITGEQVAQHLMTAWARAGTERYLALTRPQWRELFHAQGLFTRDGTPEAPPASLTLYRGAPQQYARNWSWTERLDVARSYSARADGKVWTTTAPEGHLLAYRHNAAMDLTEYVVDTRGLDINELECVREP